jgi:hypothetical protein
MVPWAIPLNNDLRGHAKVKETPILTTSSKSPSYAPQVKNMVVRFDFQDRIIAVTGTTSGMDSKPQGF